LGRRCACSIRRFTRLTNGFSKKIENHAAMVAYTSMQYNCGRVHETLRVYASDGSRDCRTMKRLPIGILIGTVAGLALSVVVVARQKQTRTPLCVELRVEFPDSTTHDLSTPEGRATAKLSLSHGDSYREFFVDLTIRDLASGRIQASIRDSRRPDSPVLDEFDLPIGGAVIRTTTAPSFGLSALGTHEQKSYGSRCG
jgi:hypothetical protein